MSADNVTICPKCSAKIEQESEHRYSRSEQTLEETWSIGISGGQFSVRYEAFCNECGFSFTFRHDQLLRKNS